MTLEPKAANKEVNSADENSTNPRPGRENCAMTAPAQNWPTCASSDPPPHAKPLRNDEKATPHSI